MTTKLLTLAMALLLASPAGAASIKLATIGNSITDESGYPEKLQTLLGARVLVQNAGRYSTTVLNRGDAPYWKCDKFPLIFPFQPDIVTIKLGTNDTKPQNWQHSADFVADLNALIDTLETMPSHPRVFLVLPVPVFPNDKSINGDILDTALIPKIQQVAAARGLPIIDVHFPLRSSGFLFPDGVHPSPNGADSIAAIFHRTLRATPVPLLVPNHLEFEVSARQAVAAKAVSLLTLATAGLEPVQVAGAAAWLSVRVNAARRDSQAVVCSVLVANLPGNGEYLDTLTLTSANAQPPVLKCVVRLTVRNSPTVTRHLAAQNVLSPQVAWAAAGTIQVTMPYGGAHQFELRTLDGKLVAAQQFSGTGTFRLASGPCAPGVYNLEITTGNRTFRTRVEGD